jgi:LPS O-antigen subunit length determinant protein (WzzB/FepE family)
LAKKAMTELDEKGKELQATRGEVAHLKEQVRAVRDKHADHVAQLKEALRVANAHHAAEVRRLVDEHHKARSLYTFCV